MNRLTTLADDELNRLVAQDHAAAMTEKAYRYLARNNLKKARMFFTLSSILGDKLAHIELARIFEEEDNFEEAYELYARAYAKGEDSVLPRLASIILRTNQELGMELLRQNAFDGHWGCIKELIEIYKQDPQNPEYTTELTFWQNRLQEMEQAAATASIENRKKRTHSTAPNGTTRPRPKTRMTATTAKKNITKSPT